jgi:plastocyanin
MKIAPVFLLITALMATVAHAADITGVITFKGTPPTESDLSEKISDESADCAAMYPVGKLPTTHFYVVGTKGEFADVVVYLKNMDGKSTGASAPAAVLDQRGCVYVPGIFAVQTGQKIAIKNSDECLHNVHAVPTDASGNPDYNNAQQIGGPELIYTFPKPEQFLKFRCDVHSWMFAWVSVFDHPYFSMTDKDGKFTIKNVPPGKYTIEAAHRKAGTQAVEIEVKDAPVTAEFKPFELK